MNYQYQLIADEKEPTTPHVEIFVFTKNISPNTPLYTFSMTAVSNVYNTSFTVTTDYNYSTYTLIAHEESSPSGWDHIATVSNPTNAPQIGYGLYKFYNSDLDFYFYIDWRDTRYPYEGPCTGQCEDIWVWYDSTQKFYISSYSTQTPYAEILRGDYLTIWDLQGKGTPSTTGFQNYWGNCLAIIQKYNSEDFLVPLVMWDSIHNFTATGYKIYRSIKPQGMPPGTFSLIATVSSSTFSYLDESVLVNGNQVAYYKVKAYSGSSESDYTNTASISISGFYKGGNTEIEKLRFPFILDQNYPNPFNPATEIRYSLPEPSNVKIVIINTIGQEVTTLVDAQQSEGEHSVTFHPLGLPSGVYFYRMYVGGFTEIKKMTYLR